MDGMMIRARNAEAARAKAPQYGLADVISDLDKPVDVSEAIRGLVAIEMEKTIAVLAKGMANKIVRFEGKKSYTQNPKTDVEVYKEVASQFTAALKKYGHEGTEVVAVVDRIKGRPRLRMKVETSDE